MNFYLQAIPNHVGGPYKRSAGITLLEKAVGLPVYQPLNIGGSEALGGHPHQLGANPATVQSHHPSLYHQALLQQLQQQQASQQTFLSPTCKKPLLV